MKEFLTVLFQGLLISLIFASPVVLVVENAWIIWLPVYAACCALVYFIRKARRKARERKRAIAKN